MANEDRRGVGTRLFVQGGEIVRKTFAEIGDSGKKMWAEIAAGEKTANPALKAVSRGVGEVKDGVSNLAGESGAAGRVLGGFGAAGFALAGILGGLSVAGIRAREALSWADELGDSATKVNESASALYELRQATRLAGGEIEGADDALANFNKRLGDAQNGNKKALKVFDQLGFTQTDLQKFQKGSDLLPEFAKRLQTVQTIASRASIIERAGLGGIKPVLEDANKSFEESIAYVRSLGLHVDDNIIQKGGEAQDRLETIAEVIKLKMNVALIDAAPLLVDVGNGLANSAEGAARFFNKIRDGLPAIQSFLDKTPALRAWLEFAGKAAWNITPFPWIGKGVSALSVAGQTKTIGAGIKGMLAGKPVSLEGSEWAPASKPKERPAQDRPFGGNGDSPNAKAAKDRVAGLTDQQKAALLEAMALEQRLAVARAAGNKVLEQAIEDEKFRADQLDKYVKAGESADTARILSGNDLAARQFNRDASAYRASFKDPADFTSTADLMKPVLDAFNEGKRLSDDEKESLSQDFGDAFATGLDAALHGDFWDFLANEFYRASLAGISKGAAGLFSTIAERATPGGMLSKVLGVAGSLFGSGGGRAAGGDMEDGYAFRAAEHDTELALIGRSGKVFDHDTTKALLRDAAGGGNGGVIVNATYAPTFGPITGSGPEVDALRRQMEESERSFQANVIAAVNEGMARRQIR